MKKHVKIYMEAFGLDEGDFIPCECCSTKAVDIHHLKFRSQGGKDEINNLIALCRRCHDSAHSSKILNESFKLLHESILNDRKTAT